MLVADVKCYHCGFVSGEVRSEDGQMPRLASFRPATTAAAQSEASVGLNSRPRCLRCGGPVYLDDVRRVRPRPLFDALEKPKRGRPRKSVVLAEAS